MDINSSGVQLYTGYAILVEKQEHSNYDVDPPESYIPYQNLNQDLDQDLNQDPKLLEEYKKPCDKNFEILEEKLDTIEKKIDKFTNDTLSVCTYKKNTKADYIYDIGILTMSVSLIGCSQLHGHPHKNLSFAMGFVLPFIYPISTVPGTTLLKTLPFMYASILTGMGIATYYRR